MDNRDNYWTRYRNRSFGRRRFLAGSGVVAVGGAAILAGCGDDDDDGGDETSTATSTGTNGTSTATGTGTATSTASSGDGERGGTIRVSKAAQDTGLDPAITVTNPLHPAKAFNHLLMYQLSEDKAWLDAAVSFEQVDDTTMTFKLRPDMKFAPEVEGGRVVTSEDVAFSYSRFPATLKSFGSEVNRIQWGWMGALTQDGTAFVGGNFETPDATTFTIKLPKPYASAIPSLGSSAFAIVSPALAEANGNNLSQVMQAGAGPYIMTKRDNTGTMYERNPNYYKHSPAEGPFIEEGPYIDVWEELIIADPVAAEARFLEGDLDFLNSALVALDKLKAEELEGEDGVVISRHTAPTNYPMTLDNAKWAPHPQLRKALTMAIDRDAYIQSIHLGDGIYGSPVGPIFESVLDQDELKELQPFNAQEARQMWEAGGGNEVFPDGLKTISATFSQASQTSVDFIKRQLEENLGITVTVTPQDLAGYVSIATASGPVKEWDFFMASEGSLTTIPDYNALTFWSPSGYGAIFGNMKLDSTVPENAAFAQESQKRFDEQSAILDAEERNEYLREMQRFFLEENRAAIPLPVGAFTYTARRDRVQNYPENDAQLGNSSLGAYRAPNLWLKA